MRKDLCKFEKLDAKLTEWGFPAINGKSGFQVIRVDFDAQKFQRAVEERKIEFRNDGIYLIHEGREWKGYMYMPTYNVSKFGLPKFHLIRCETIQKLFSGGYGQLYKWSNNKLNDIKQRGTNEIYEYQKLQLCTFCKKAIFDIDDTEDFFETLDTETKEEDANIETDIFGYVKDWQKISKAYRKNKDYTCESCGIKPKNNLDKRFWHTHHLDGNKTNNIKSNLECLCVLCHSYKDLRHEENFDKKRMKRELDSFVEKYKEDLKRANNHF
jgi:5-methylcytosine-specific restriction endonuclease McrA